MWSFHLIITFPLKIEIQCLVKQKVLNGKEFSVYDIIGISKSGKPALFVESDRGG